MADKDWEGREMIFYFTGTGNSHAAAMQLQYRLGGRLINITDCMQKGTFSFEAGEDEPVGIVCPVYFGGLPSIVNDFLLNLEFTNKPTYIYGLLTFGGRLFGAREVLETKLSERGLTLSAAWSVTMPANFAILYEPTNEEKADIMLDEADDKLQEIISQIQKRAEVKDFDPEMLKESEKHYKMYEEMRKTGPFYTDDSCIGCGVCAGRCPVKAIEMKDGTPTWVKDTCVFCMSCLRCNAIQYEDKLKGRYRYRHPIYRKKKKAAEASCH